ncbi:tetratricopeptide repeat protein [bacterium]|nr:tetratricopeptide repeat protein [bacterium]
MSENDQKITMSEKRLEIRLFGGVDLQLDGLRIDNLPTRKAEALLAYLVCQRRPIGREVLADLLWDDRAQDQALANLRSILSSLRRSLDAHLDVTRQSVAFNYSSNHWLDVHVFEQKAALLAEQPSMTEGADASRRTQIEALQSAVDLYRGDFLEGFYLRESLGFEEWAILARERYQRTAVTLLWQLIDLTMLEGDYIAALRHVDTLLRFDNLSERAHRARMLILARTGQYNAALQHYDSLRTLLDDELGVDPAGETTALQARIVAVRDIKPPSLPPPLPHFVGRDEEMATLAAQLRDPNCRLVTVLGAGGMGKTRLVVETVRQLMARQPGQFLHGVYFVPLADVTDARRFVLLLAETLGLALSGPEEPLALVIDFLRDKEMLLVLDNFEQLLTEANVPAQILAEAPAVKLLVTSQEALHLHEEWIFDLFGLPTPNENEKEDAAASYGAVQLFLQIAQRLSPRYRPSAADVGAIAQICRLLEGMPLGIELAAAWIRQFPTLQIADEIRRGLDFLTTNVRNIPDRHRSLRAAFEYTWRLLPQASQSVFAQLAVFHGGFTAEAAAEIAGAKTQHLGLLVEKSLLRLELGRYTMHPMLSRFAAEKLTQDAAGEQAASERHTVYYLDFLAAQESGESPEQRRVIRGELANVRAAWLWAAARQDHAQILRAGVILHGFFSAQSWFRQGIDVFDDALNLWPHGAALSPVLATCRCELLGRRARMQIQIGELERANQALDEALTYLHHVDDPVRQSTVLGYRAMSAYHGGDMPLAVELTHQSLALDEASGDQDGVAFAVNFLGIAHKSLGEYALATDYFNRAVALYDEMNDDLGTAMSLNNLGNLAQAQGDYATAHEHYMTCSRLFREQDHIHGAATTLGNAGRLSRKLGNLAEAESLLHESLMLKEEIHDNRGVAVALLGLADVALAGEDSAKARSLLKRALTLAQEVGDVKLMLEAVAGYATLYLGEDDNPQLGACLLVFVLSQPALAHEVRDTVETLRSDLDSAVWQEATVWAEGQLLPAVVEAILLKDDV